MRRLHGACRRPGGALLRDAGRRAVAGQEVVTLEGLGTPQQAASGADGLHRGAGGAVRLLHQRHDHGGRCVPGADTRSRPRPRSSEALANNLCRCGTHARIVRAVHARGRHAEGGSHERDHLPPLAVLEGRRRPRRQPSLRPAAARCRAGRGAASPWRSTRSTPSSPSTPRARHGLFRQGRSRHRHPHRAARRSPPRSSTCR